MGKYLKKFETQSAYEAAESSLILPNVSLTVDNNTVHYNPYFDPYNGHEYAEIGGLKWATMNIGATGVTDTGLYFQWGDISGYTAAQCGGGEGQKYFGWADYKYGNGTSDPGDTGMTKYNSTDGLTTLTSTDDAAKANWGGSWRMPTTDEFITLGNSTTSGWTNNYEGSGVKGLVLTSNTNQSVKLFFPAVGRCSEGVIRDAGSNGFYWSSSLNASNSSMRYAYYLSFLSSQVFWHNGSLSRYNGFPVRCVVD